MAFDLDPTYKQVPERIADFKEKHPEGTLQPADPTKPFDIVTIGDKTFVVYTAAAYRHPDDPRPGVGIAWEPFPGKTPYTRDSELQNAETSAWGRAIVAALASESKSVASAEEVRNRQADRTGCPVCGDSVPGEGREPVRAHLVNVHGFVRLPDGSVKKPDVAPPGDVKDGVGHPAEDGRGEPAPPVTSKAAK